MHLPSCNAELRPRILRQFIHENPLGVLTTALRSSSYPLLQSSHIPWIVDVSDDGNEAELGILRGHIARQNPQAKAIIESLTTRTAEADLSQETSAPYLDEDVLVLFNGPAHHYVTPKFYAETKPATGKVVPTWDYEAVQVYGKAKIYFDTRSEAFGAFLARQLSDLSNHAETSIMGYGKGDKSETHPWQVADAPSRYIELLKKNIIGIEVEITSMAGRFKMSQEKKRADRDGVIEGFKNMQSGIGTQMSEIVAERAAEFDCQNKQKASS